MRGAADWGRAFVLVALTVGMVACARAPDAGTGVRLGFVLLSLTASVVVWRSSRRSLSARHVLLVAFVLRLLALPLAPSLSDDGYRYVWDGRQTLAGVSPYAHRPASATVADAALLARLNSPGYYSVYPPLAQAVFATGTGLSGGEARAAFLGIKVLVALAELGGILALLTVARPSLVALYAWSPVAVVEIAGQGHTEGLLVGALGMLLWALARRPALAGWAVAAATAAATAVKLWPVALFVVAARRVSRPQLVAAAVATVAGLSPMLWPATWPHVAESLRLYAGHFDWYHPAYRLAKLAVWPAAGDGSGPAVARAMGVVWVAICAGAVLTDDGGRAAGRRGVVRVVAAYVVLSPVLHPWHLVPVLLTVPLLQVGRRRAVAAWVAASHATYLAYTHGAPVGEAVSWIGWGSALLLLASATPWLLPVMRHRARAKWDRLAHAVGLLPASCRLLDLGCGEGFVGQHAAQASGAAVTLADVVDLNRTERPLQRLASGALPFEPGAFDVTVLSFVLHHASDPASLLSEARRVTRGRVVALESVVRWETTKPLLHWLDKQVNLERSGGRMVDQDPHWRSVAEWRRLCEREGWGVEIEGPVGWLHPTAVLVFSRTDSAVADSASSHTADGRRRSHVH